MNSFWILESDLFQISICSVKSLWLAMENDIFHLRELMKLVICAVLFIFRPSELSIEVEKTLSSIFLSSIISTLHELLDEPLNNWLDSSVI